MPTSFEQQNVKAEAQARALFRKLSLKIHPDKFNAHCHSEFEEVLKENKSLREELENCRKKAEGLFQKLSGINNDQKISPTQKLVEMEALENDINSFLNNNGFAELMKELQNLKDKKQKGQEKNGKDKKICSNCRKESNADVGFCPFCWAKFDENGQNGNGKNDEDIEKERQRAYAEAQKKSEEDEQRKAEEEKKETEKNENKAKDNETGNEQIEQLKKELEEARKKYAEADYKVNNNISKLKAVLGKFLKTEPADVSEVNEALIAYQSKASELSRAQIDALKDNKNLDSEMMKKELGDLVKYFNYGEKINLFEARTNARAEANKDNIAFKFLKKSGDVINKYRKLNWKTKIIGGVVFGVITGGSLVMAQRGFGSVVAGVGATVAAEALQRKMEQRKSEKEKENILNGFENSEEKMESVMQYLNNEIGGYEKSLKSELKKARIRKFIGLGAAAGTFAVGNLAGSFLREHLIGKINSAQEYLQDWQTDPNQVSSEEALNSENARAAILPENNGETNNIPEKGFLSEIVDKKPAAASVVEMAADVKKGGSLNSTISQYLNEHPELIAKYNSYPTLGGGKNLNAEQIAHRMSEEFAKNNADKFPKGVPNLVHEGAQLKFSSDGMHLSEVSGDDRLGYLSKSKIATGNKGSVFEEMRPKKGIDPLEVKKNLNFQRSNMMARMLEENEGKIKSLDLKQEELLKEINNANGVENTRPGVYSELLKVQQDMEQLREANRGLSSNLGEQNIKANVSETENLRPTKTNISADQNMKSQNSVPESRGAATSAINKAEPIGERNYVSQENWKGNGSGTKFMKSFENNFGNAEDNRQLFKNLSGKNFVDSDPKITAANIKISLFDSCGRRSVFEGLKNQSMDSILKNPQTKAELFNGLGAEEQKLFKEMIKAVPPEKHRTEPLSKWVLRVAFAMDNIKGK